jgi:hypothetical protein
LQQVRQVLQAKLANLPPAYGECFGPS